VLSERILHQDSAILLYAVLSLDLRRSHALLMEQKQGRYRSFCNYSPFELLQNCVIR
jgi:hypothetical protein